MCSRHSMSEAGTVGCSESARQRLTLPMDEELVCGRLCSAPRRDSLRGRPIPVPPENCRHGPPQIARRRLAFRSSHLEQWLPNQPCSIGKHRRHHAHRKALCSHMHVSSPDRPQFITAPARSWKGSEISLRVLQTNIDRGVCRFPFRVSCRTTQGSSSSPAQL